MTEDCTATAEASPASSQEKDKKEPQSQQEQQQQPQTRFNFYNAEEINKVLSKDDDEDDGHKKSLRFNFYNAAEVNKEVPPFKIPSISTPTHKRTTSQPSPLPEPVVDTSTPRSASARKSIDQEPRDQAPPPPPTMESLERPTTAASSTDNVAVAAPQTSDVAVATNRNVVDSSEILKSLKEQERQRRRPRPSPREQRRPPPTKERNPYEDAIKEALYMLRSQSFEDNDAVRDETPRHAEEGQDVVMQARMEDSSRIAKYASVERKPSTVIEENSQQDDYDSTWTPVSNEHPVYAEELIRRRSESYSPEPQESPRLLHKNDSSSQEEVQKGVEQVLLAILERANTTKQRPSPDHDSELDALSKAMESLLQPTLSFETASTTTRSRRPNRRESDEYQLSHHSKPQATSVVEELLENENENGDALLETPSSTKVSMHQDVPSPTALEDTLLESDEAASEDSTPPAPKDLLEEVEFDDEEEEDYVKDTSFGESTLNNVLGPLSRKAGGTTGVVLEEALATENAPPPPPPPEDDPDAPAPLSPSSLYETLSSAVRDAESFISLMTSGYPSSKDKYSTHEEDDTPAGAAFDDDAHELMRSLCAHLLPYGMDKDEATPNAIPAWDESNPEEAGYRIIRLSKAQLVRVEQEFENMIRSVKHSSERDLRNGSISDQDRSGEPPKDEDFERDLEEAEELLDQEERRREEEEEDDAHGENVESEDDDEESEYGSSTDTGTYSSTSGTNDQTQSVAATDDDDTIVLTALPEFPGVKRTGRGEIGDLEYFHLPIIYKSNVTGFEPTKDLYLEPGNVVAGQYLVESELGTAAFSTAYRCVDLSSDLRTEPGGQQGHEEVCLKVIKNTKDFFDQSLDEIKILELLRQTGQCHEKYILEMKTFFYHREHLVIVTELLRQNLFEFGKFITESAEEPYFSQPRLCFITRQVLIALDFVHKMGLVHSDVKPENILLGSYSRAQVKLIDFGSSCYLTDRHSSYIQSRSYRAPEVVLGLPYDGKIDIWSLGCVVAEMYTGEVTFQNDSLVSMLSRIEAICGPFPRHMIAQGRQSGRFFTKSGLLFEHVDEERRDGHPSNRSELDNVDQNALLDVFQPKRTTMAARLGIREITTEEEAHFVDFCSKLLAVDPDSRPTAEEALKHPWIVAGAVVTEEDIKYPSN